MAIKSTASIAYRGLTVPAPGAYARYLRTEIDGAGVTVVFREYASKEAAAKQLSQRRPAKPTDYDPANPLHAAQYKAAGSPDLASVDGHGEPWRPTVSESFWDGESCKERPLQERRVMLSAELAESYLEASLKGDTPSKAGSRLEAMTQQAYLAAMASGEFADAEAV